MFSGKTKPISLITTILFAGLFTSQMSGPVVSSWADSLIKAIHVSGATTTGLQNTHISGVTTYIDESNDLASAWDEVAALPVHVSGARNSFAETLHVSGAETALADLPDLHVSGASTAQTTLEDAHLSGANTVLGEARISGALTETETMVAHVSGSVTSGADEQTAASQILSKRPTLKTTPEEVIASIPDGIHELHLPGASTPKENTFAHTSGAKIQVAEKDITLKETDSTGSYNHGTRKSEGSKSKSYSPSYGKHGAHGKPSASHGYSKYQSYDSHGGHHKSHRKHEEHGHAQNPFMHIMKFKYVLGLSDSQLEEIKNKEIEYKKIKLRAEAEHQISHLELDQLSHSETVNESRIRTLADEISATKSKKIHAMAEAKIGILNILTPEQRTKVHKMHLHHD